MLFIHDLAARGIDIAARGIALAARDTALAARGIALAARGITHGPTAVETSFPNEVELSEVLHSCLLCSS